MNRQNVIKDLSSLLRQDYNDLKSKEMENLRENDFLTELDEHFRNNIESYFRNREEKFQLQSEDVRNFEEDPENPDYTVVFDEMDGTHHLIEQEGPFGPVMGIAEGENPSFKDIVAAGFLDLNNEKLYYAVKDKGVFLKTEDSERRIQTSDKEQFEEGIKTKVLLQQGFLAEYPEIAAEAWKRWCNYYGSQGKHYALIASGRRDVYITGGHSKIEAKPSNTPEELAGMYLLIEESGGYIVDWNGRTIEDNEIGMAKGKNHDVVAAATEELAREAVNDCIPERYGLEKSNS